MTIPFQFFNYKKGHLESDGISMEQIAHQVGTPTYVYSERGFLEPFLELKKGLNPIDHQICFAMKSNSNPSILKLLKKAGSGMDIVSGGELELALRAGVAPSQIVYSGVGKSADEMRRALKAGIYAFNVESQPELNLLNQVALDLKSKAPVSLRFNPDVNPKTHPYISTGLKKNKFGLERREIFSILENLKKLPAIEIWGVSIHIGSQILSLKPFDEAFQKLSELVVKITPLLPMPLRFLDLGGGLGIRYCSSEKPFSIQSYCEKVLKYFGPKQWSGRILVEPGRIITGNAGILVTRVLYRKKRRNKDILIVDAGMNDLMRPALYGSYHEIVPVQQNATRSRLRKTDIVGPVCESSDCFAEGYRFPESIKEGDLLAILSAGAYGFSMSGNYNARPRCAEVLVADHQFKVIRRREVIRY